MLKPLTLSRGASLTSNPICCKAVVANSAICVSALCQALARVVYLTAQKVQSQQWKHMCGQIKQPRQLRVRSQNAKATNLNLITNENADLYIFCFAESLCIWRKKSQYYYRFITNLNQLLSKQSVVLFLNILLVFLLFGEYEVPTRKPKILLRRFCSLIIAA